LKFALYAPSGHGKTTAHDKKVAFDPEEHPEYQARKDHYEWFGADPKLGQIRNAYWSVFAQGYIHSNFPFVALHPAEVVVGKSDRREVLVFRVVDFALANDDKFNSSRLTALAIGLGKALKLYAEDTVSNLAEGYVSDVAEELGAKPLSKDEILLEEERIFNAIQPEIAKLDIKFGYKGASQ